MASFDSKLIFERKKREIELGIQNLIECQLGLDHHQSEETSQMTSEISKAYEIDRKLSIESSNDIWNILENTNLGNEWAYFYFGLVMDYDNKLKEKILEFIKPCLQRLEVNLQMLIKNCSVIELTKLMTFYTLTEKADKTRLNQENIVQIICSFQDRLRQLYFDDNVDNLSADLLIRRFSQLLKFTIKRGMGGFYKLNSEFWNLILNRVTSVKTFKYVYSALMNHVAFISENKKEKSHDLIFHVLSLKEELGASIKEKFFLKHKDWVSSYIQFYFNFISDDAIPDYKKKSILEKDIANAILVFISYITDKNSKNTKYIITDSQLIRIFDFCPLSEDIYNLLGKLVEVQLTSQFYDINFLRKYFSSIKTAEHIFNISTARSIATQLMLFSCLYKEPDCEKIKSDICEYAVNLFEYCYNTDKSTGITTDTKSVDDIVNILSSILRYLPHIWDKLSEVKLKIDSQFIGNNRKWISFRDYIWWSLDEEREIQINVNVPEQFNGFIDNLIGYLRNGCDVFWENIFNIVSIWNDGFKINSAEYTDNDYWAKVLIEFCWGSENLAELREYWKNKKNEESKTNENIIAEETKEIIMPVAESKIDQIEDKIATRNEVSKGSTSDSKTGYSLLAHFDLFSDILTVTPQSISELTIPEEHKVNEERKETNNSAIALMNQKQNKLTENDINLQAELLEELKNSFILQILFGVQTPVQVKKWLISQLSNLFKLSIKNTNFIMKTVSFVVQLISKPIEKANATQLAIFQNLAASRVVKEGLAKIDLNIDLTKNYHDYVYFAYMPFDLAGVTVLGGDILINSKYNDCKALDLCAQKIIFVHELAHHIRKTKNGFYEINEKTPPLKKNKKISKGAPGAIKATALPYTNEGGWQLESEIFWVFVVKINDKQVDFLNRIENWRQPLENFKYCLSDLYSDHSEKYQLGRSSDGMHSLERRSHNDN